MTQLYKIANSFAELANSDLPAEMIADTLEGIEGEMEIKVEQCLAIIKNELAYASALRGESDNLQLRARQSERRVERLKTYISESLSTTGKSTLKAGVHQVTVRSGSKSVEITNVDDIPVDFVKYDTTVTPDKAAIKKQIEAGFEVPGATIKIGKPSLIIK